MQHARRDTAFENASLMDNWDDAEGYYSKWPVQYFIFATLLYSVIFDIFTDIFPLSLFMIYIYCILQLDTLVDSILFGCCGYCCSTCDCLC